MNNTLRYVSLDGGIQMPKKITRKKPKHYFNSLKWLFLLCTLSSLTACFRNNMTRYPVYAPVSNGNFQQVDRSSTQVASSVPTQASISPARSEATTPQSGKTYTVKQGETLYSVAWRYHIDYRELASINHIPQPYAIYPGQVLVLDSNTPTKFSTKTKRSNNKVPLPAIASPNSLKGWSWPTSGKLEQTFSNVRIKELILPER